MVFNREEAAQRAEASRTNVPGTCQLWTHVMFGTPSAGDFDGDGAADAEDGWKMEPAKAKHPGDRRPPRGVPVSYLGGSHDNGHRAVSLGKGMIRSTDAGGTGIVATVPLNWPEVHWGLTYAGWSTTCDGVEIPLPPVRPKQIPKRKLEHPAKGRPEYEGDSSRAIDHAAANHIPWIDLNALRDKDGVVVNTHYPYPLRHGFIDPLGLLPRDTSIFDMTEEEWSRLRTEAGKPPYRIRSMKDRIARALLKGVKVEVDLKCMLSPAAIKPLLHGDDVIVKTMGSLNSPNDPNIGTPWDRLVKAKHADGTTLLICPRPFMKVPEVYAPDIDFYRRFKPRFV